MKGRKPVPTEVRLKRGETPEAPPIVVGGRIAPRMPLGLNAYQKTAWRTVVADLSKANLLDHADAAVIEAFAVFWGRARQARAMVNREGLLSKSAHGGAHAAVGIEERSFREVRQLADQLPLSPWGRARLGLHLGITPSVGVGADEDLARELGPSPRQLHLVAAGDL